MAFCVSAVGHGHGDGGDRGVVVIAVASAGVVAALCRTCTGDGGGRDDAKAARRLGLRGLGGHGRENSFAGLVLRCGGSD